MTTLLSRLGERWSLMTSGMSRRDAARWKSARTMTDLGELVIAWLNGEITGVGRRLHLEHVGVRLRDGCHAGPHPQGVRGDGPGGVCLPTPRSRVPLARLPPSTARVLLGLPVA